MSTEANKRNAISFYETAYLGKPREAVELYVGSKYLQHNPVVADGKEAFIDYFERMHSEFPGKTIDRDHRLDLWLSSTLLHEPG